MAGTSVLDRVRESGARLPFDAQLTTAAQFRADALKAERTRLFGVESAARAQLTTQIGLLERAAKQERLAGRYLRIDLSVLRWRTNERFPELAAFSLQSPVFEIGADGRDSTWVHGPKNPLIRNCFHDVEKYLLRLGRPWHNRGRRYRRVLQCHWSGVIPEEARAQIVQAQAEFGKEIYILADPGEWELDTQRVPLVDPLVVGFYNGHFWLITDFDIQPFEMRAVMEAIQRG